jgi:hypothetical protein
MAHPQIPTTQVRLSGLRVDDDPIVESVLLDRRLPVHAMNIRHFGVDVVIALPPPNQV